MRLTEDALGRRDIWMMIGWWQGMDAYANSIAAAATDGKMSSAWHNVQLLITGELGLHEELKDLLTAIARFEPCLRFSQNYECVSMRSTNLTVC